MNQVPSAPYPPCKCPNGRIASCISGRRVQNVLGIVVSGIIKPGQLENPPMSDVVR